MKIIDLITEISDKAIGSNIVGTEHTHVVKDNQSGKVVGKYRSSRRAHHAANKKDLEYGAIRYSVHRIEKT